jgi:hypothetical protein
LCLSPEEVQIIYHTASYVFLDLQADFWSQGVLRGLENLLEVFFVEDGQADTLQVADSLGK